MSLRITWSLCFLLRFLSISSKTGDNFTAQSKEYKNAMIINITYSNDGTPLMKVKLGTPPQTLYLSLSTASFLTTVSHYKCAECESSFTYNPGLSSTYKLEDDKTVFWLNQKMDGVTFFEKIYLSDKYDHIDYFGLSLISKIHDSSFKGSSGYLGLNKFYFNQGGNSFSIIDMLFQDKFVIKKAFRFNFESNHSKNLFIIGNTFNEYDSLISNYSSCYSNHKTNFQSNYLPDSSFKDYWFCNLTHIHFDNNEVIESDELFRNNSIVVNKFSVFSSSTKMIIAPFSFKEAIANKLLALIEQYTNNNCQPKKDQSFIQYSCNSSYDLISNINMTLSFVLNGFGYVVEKTLLIEEISKPDAKSKIFQINIEFDKNLEGFFIFGTTFLRNFDVIFDKDKTEVGFMGGRRLNFTNYTTDYLETETEQSGSFKFYFGNLLILLLIIFLVVWYVRRSRHKKEINQSYHQMLQNI